MPERKPSVDLQICPKAVSKLAIWEVPQETCPGCKQALRAAMKDPNLAVDPTMTIEYQKLFTAASNFREVRTAQLSAPTA